MENNKIDSNYIIGFVLLFVMYGAYMFFMPETTPTTPPSKEKVVNSSVAKQSSTPSAVDSTVLVKSFGDFASFAQGTENLIIIENKDVKYTFTNLGGNFKEVELKNYMAYDDFKQKKNAPIKLIDSNNSQQSLKVTTSKGLVNLKKLYFTTNATSSVVKEGTSTKVIYTLQISPNQSITQTYIIKDKGFAVDYDLAFNNTSGLIGGTTVEADWTNELKKLENDIKENRKAAQVNYIDTEDEFNEIGSMKEGNESESLEEGIKWFSFKQKYFVSGFASKNDAFTNAKFDIITSTNDSVGVKTITANWKMPINALQSNKGNFTYYFGPNEIEQLKPVADDFHKNVYLGYDVVKPINRFIFVPLFRWVEGFVSNYGILIIVVVLIIKLALTPLIYKSYVSAAKMRVLAPEINEIKEKVGDDQVKIQQETMKLYQQVGVSPLSGCVPMLLQMPILMSVFFLFPNMIMFRQKSFLWASDLSTFDAPISWGMNLPIVGSHISLFVVLMTISSLAFTYYNNQITPDQPGPIDMKKISYVFPLVFFFVLNSFPAALSFYYLVSNIITIVQQLTVRKFIDEDKIKNILNQNKINYQTKPKKQSKFTEYLQKQLQVQEEANRQKEADLKKRKK